MVEALSSMTASVAEPATGGARRVLLVDDEKTILTLFRMLLQFELAECEVDTAGDGAEAIQRFADRRPGIIIMDLHMPVMDGLAAYRQIAGVCGARGWEMPAVVFCTGFAPPDSVVDEVKSNPHHGLLQKPVTCEALIAAVRQRMDA